MATKKNTEPEMIDEAQQEAERDNRQLMANLEAELAALKKENAALKKNSVHNASAAGGASDYERVQAACREAAEKGTDPWTEKISVLAPRIGKGEDSYWLCVNGKSMQVPANDRYFELALPFADCLVSEIKARHRAMDYIDAIEVYDPKTNPHPTENVV